MDDIKVSVIIPVYNVEKYLAECLESVICQSLKDYEVICVNDGSTDSSAQILEKYASKDSRIKIITQKNAGQSEARNTALNHAVGKYVCFLDSDDMLADNALKEMYDFAENKEVELLCFKQQWIYENKWMELEHNMSTYLEKNHNYVGIKTGREMVCEMQENHEYVSAVWTMFLKRSFLEKHKLRFYPGIIYEDNIFTLHCYIYAEKTIFINRQYYIYRIRENSTMTEKRTLHSLKSKLICYQEILKLLYTEQIDERTFRNISELLKDMLDSIQFEDAKLGIESIDYKDWKMGTLYDVMAKSMKVGFYNKNNMLLLPGMERLVECNEKVVLYGAGGIGGKVYKYLQKSGLNKKVTCFAVTKKSSQESVFGVPVLNIADIKNISEAFIIISARADYQRDMLLELEKRDVKNYLVIDGKIESLLDEQLK